MMFARITSPALGAALLAAVAAHPAAAVEWYTGAKAIEQPKTDWFSWAKPLPSKDDWIIETPRQQAAPTEPNKPKAEEFSAISMRGPTTTSGPVKTPGLLVKRNGEETSTDYSPPQQTTQYAVDISVGFTGRNTSSTTVGFTSAGGQKLDQTGPRYHVELQMDAPCCFGKSVSFTGASNVSFGASAMVGYEWSGEKGSVAGYVGANFVNVTKQFVGTESDFGLQTGVDMSAYPNESFMASLGGTFSTVNLSHYARAKMGFALREGLYIGPEAVIIGDRHGRQMRYGGHISGLKISGLQFGLAGGYVVDRKRGNGVYTTLDMRAAF